MRRVVRLLVPDAFAACEVAVIEGGAVRGLVSLADDVGTVAVTSATTSMSPDHPLCKVISSRQRAEFPLEGCEAQMLFGGQALPSVPARVAVAVPLIWEGEALGAIAVANAAAHWNREHSQLLAEVASTVAALIHDAEVSDRSAHIAGALQRALLPAELPSAPWFRLAGDYVAGATGLDVGGDWYDGEVLADGTLALGVGDVAGHGVHAAARMGELRSAMAALRLVQQAPDELIHLLHRLPTMSSSFATALCARVDRRGSLSWACAGHPPPLVIRPTGEAILLPSDGSPPLGSGPVDGVPLQQWPLEPGDTVLLYTDGLVERRDEPITDSLDRLASTVSRLAGNSPHELLSNLVANHAATSTSEAATGDDLALVACQLLSA